MHASLIGILRTRHIGVLRIVVLSAIALLIWKDFGLLAILRSVGLLLSLPGMWRATACRKLLVTMRLHITRELMLMERMFYRQSSTTCRSNRE